MSDQSTKEKRTAIQRLLDDEYVLVHLVSGAPGVQLPSHLYSHPTVTLKLSRLFRGRLEVKEREISAELLFGENYFTCIVPFTAIWAVTGVKGSMLTWEGTGVKVEPAAQRAEVREMDAGGSDAESETTKKRPHLRRVK
jgi:hypothetical protein